MVVVVGGGEAWTCSGTEVNSETDTDWMWSGHMAEEVDFTVQSGVTSG